MFANVMVFISGNFYHNLGNGRDALESHGLGDSVTDIRDWLSAEKEQHASQRPWESEPDKVLLVDSQGSKEATESLLNSIEEERKQLSYKGRDWITVYDWRVLEHLAILENDALEKKHYDGFEDPWRRWFCGLV
jgi:DNA ligase-4